jgi:hypothetical protein
MNDNITEINKDSFWKLIQSAKETCGQDMDAMMAFLKDWLVSMGPKQAQNFHDILHAYRSVISPCRRIRKISRKPVLFLTAQSMM